MTDSTASEEPEPNSGAKRRRHFWLFGLVGLVFVWLFGDALHCAMNMCAVDQWASEVELTAEGVIEGCEAYQLVPGDDTNETPSESELGTRGAVLLVHGFNASPRHWEFVAPEIAEAGFAVRVMLLPGFAEPFFLHAERDPQQWVEAVGAELATLRKEYAEVGVVGHSLGGAVTIRALIETPDAADWAVLVAPAVEVSSARSPVFSTRTWYEVSQRLLLFTDVVKSPFPMDCRVPGRTDWPGRMPFSSAKIVEALFTLLDRNAPDAELFTTPVTMVVAADDRIVDTPAAEDYFGRLASADKELVVLEESGHEVPLDSEWKRIVEAVDSRAASAVSTNSEE